MWYANKWRVALGNNTHCYTYIKSTIANKVPMVGQLVARKEHSQREGTKCEMRISEVTNGNTTHGDTWIESTKDNKMPMVEQGIVRVEQSQRERNQSDMRKSEVTRGHYPRWHLKWIHNRQDAVAEEHRDGSVITLISMLHGREQYQRWNNVQTTIDKVPMVEEHI